MATAGIRSRAVWKPLVFAATASVIAATCVSGLGAGRADATVPAYAASRTATQAQSAQASATLRFALTPQRRTLSHYADVGKGALTAVTTFATSSLCTPIRVQLFDGRTILASGTGASGFTLSGWKAVAGRVEVRVEGDARCPTGEDIALKVTGHVYTPMIPWITQPAPPGVGSTTVAHLVPARTQVTMSVLVPEGGITAITRFDGRCGFLTVSLIQGSTTVAVGVGGDRLALTGSTRAERLTIRVLGGACAGTVRVTVQAPRRVVPRTSSTMVAFAAARTAA